MDADASAKPTGLRLLGHGQSRRAKAGFWAIDRREQLPVIRVPLRLEDGDVRIDLQAALNSAYEAAAYERYSYDDMPEPALGSEEAAWAEQFRPAL